MKKIKETKYVFYCDACDTWHDRNEVMESCQCGRPVRLLEGEDRAYFYHNLVKAGYKVVPREEL